MIKLINGRGQLGDVLEQKINLYNNFDGSDTYIYHTWKLNTKSYEEQNLEFKKFKKFVDKHFKNRIIFISTFSEKDDWYVHFKQLSESYLLNYCKNALVVKLPTFIGNHCNMFSIEKLKKNENGSF